MEKIILTIVLTLLLGIKSSYVSQQALEVYSGEALLVSLALALLASSLILMMKKGIYLYAFLVNLVTTIVLYVQYLYIEYFSVPMSLFVFLQTKNSGGMAGSILGRLSPGDALFFVDVLVLLVFCIKKRKKTAAGKTDIKMKTLFVIAIAASLTVACFKPVTMIASGNGNNIIQKFTPFYYVEHYGILGHQILDGYQFFTMSEELVLAPSEKVQIQEFIHQKQTVKQESGALTEGMFEGKNVVYLHMESIQNFVLNQKVGTQEITPFMNKMLENSIYFSSTYPQTAEGNSSDAELLSLTSIYPVKEGSTFFRYPYQNYPSILKDLKTVGYGSYGFHGDEGEFWNRDQVYPSLGFDKYYDIDEYPHEEKDLIGMGLSDKTFFEDTANKMNTLPQPFASYIITLTSHTPFEIPEEEKAFQMEQPELQGKLIERYLQSVNYTDRSLEAMFNGLSEEVKNNSIFVVFGDHSGIFSKTKPQVEQWLGKTITDEEWMTEYSTVPFFIYNPSLEKTEIKEIAGQVDIRPTISYLLGLDRSLYEPTSFGINLIENKNTSVFLRKGDYGVSSVITETEEITEYTDKELRSLDYSEKMIKSNFE